MEMYRISLCFFALLMLHKPGFCYSAIEDATRQPIQNQNLLDEFSTRENGNSSKARHPDISKTRRKITPIMFRKPADGEIVCSSLDDFPYFFSDEQRENGAVVLSFIVGIYCFTLLAVICDNYFLPCVERICEFMHLSQDVAAATFMAMATSAPELFVNIIGTFITESDIGIGTIVGSSLFNALGVAALGSLAVKTSMKVDWWPVTRDCLLYLVAICLLVVMTWDGLIFWYEGMILFVVYFIYFTIMFNNVRISNCCKGLIAKYFPNSSSSNAEQSTVIVNVSLQPPIFFINDALKPHLDLTGDEKINDDESLKYYCEKPKLVETTSVNLESYSSNETQVVEDIVTPKRKWFSLIFFIYVWPIKFILSITVPNPKTKPRLFPVTFLMCIVFIGANSYMISWMITVIGHTFGISESVLGLTFLAAGSCLPEAISIIIMSRKGEGSMGVSNALGANTMNILLSLGLPWFIKTMIGSREDNGSFIEITSGSIEYTILGLILVTVALYATMFFSKFTLTKRVGVVLIVVYSIFLTMAVVMEVLFIQTQPC